jgi:hypothetical protein
MDLMVYSCDDCESKKNPNSEKRECLSCRKPANGQIMRKVKICGEESSGVHYYVHHVCAMMLFYVYKIQDLDSFTYTIEKKDSLMEGP